MKAIVIIGLILTALASRIVWSYGTGLFPCCLFWATMLAFNLIFRQFFMLPGFLCNAAATIANGGFMPSNTDLVHTGLYVALSPDSNLPFLCDIFWGCSLGDFLLFAGLGFTLFFSALKTTQNRTHAVR